MRLAQRNTNRLSNFQNPCARAYVLSGPVLIDYRTVRSQDSQQSHLSKSMSSRAHIIFNALYLLASNKNQLRLSSTTVLQYPGGQGFRNFDSFLRTFSHNFIPRRAIIPEPPVLKNCAPTVLSYAILLYEFYEKLTTHQGHPEKRD